MDTHFDFLILGTNLPNSILAAALSLLPDSPKVLHVDVNAHYGAEHASLSPNELAPDSSVPLSRQYSLSLAPSIIPSTGSFIDAIVKSGVSKYSGFKLLDAVGVFSNDRITQVPGTKEDIFKSRTLSLVTKRRLMKFLLFAASEFEGTAELTGKETHPFAQFLGETFSLDGDVRDAIVYALAHCDSADEPSLPALIRIRKYLRSVGRYGNTPFLVAYYGGLGEIAQGFCRTCAVHGGVYILGRPIKSLKRSSEDGPWSIEIDEVPDVLTADVLVIQDDYEEHLPPDIPRKEDTNHGIIVQNLIAILNRPIIFSSDAQTEAQTIREPSGSADDLACSAGISPDSSIIMFPPSSLSSGAAENVVRAVIYGNNTMSAPRGSYVVHISTLVSSDHNADPHALLLPYLAALQARTSEPEQASSLFTHAFTRRAPSLKSAVIAQTEDTNLQRSRLLRTHAGMWSPSEVGDASAQEAERLFWQAVQSKRRSPSSAEDDLGEMWPDQAERREDED